MSLPFLITPKEIDGETYCCKFDGGRRTQIVEFGTIINQEPDGYFLPPDPMGDPVFGALEFVVCCGSQVDIQITITNLQNPVPWDWRIIVDGETYDAQSGVGGSSDTQVFEISVSLENKACGSRVRIEVDMTDAPTTIEIGTVN